MVRNFKGVVRVADVQAEFDNLLNNINDTIDRYNSSMDYEDIDYNNVGPELAPINYTLSIGGLKSVLDAYDGTIFGANIYKVSSDNYIVSEGVYIKDRQIYRLPSKPLSGSGQYVYYNPNEEIYTFEGSGPREYTINANIVGNPTVNDATLSGFSVYDYAIGNISHTYDRGTVTSFTIETEIITPTEQSTTSNGRIFNWDGSWNQQDSLDGPYIEFSPNSTIHLTFYAGGNYYPCSAVSNPLFNTKYYLKWVYDGTDIKGYYKLSKSGQYILCETQTYNNDVYRFERTDFAVGYRVSNIISSDGAVVFKGSVNMLGLKIYINGNTEYIGATSSGGGVSEDDILISKVNTNRTSRLCNTPDALNESIPDFSMKLESKSSGYVLNGNQYLSNADKGQFYSGSAGRNCKISLLGIEVAYHQWHGERNDSYWEPFTYMFIPKGIPNPYSNLYGELIFAAQKVWNYILNRPARN